VAGEIPFARLMITNSLLESQRLMQPTTLHTFLGYLENPLAPYSSCVRTLSFDVHGAGDFSRDFSNRLIPIDTHKSPERPVVINNWTGQHFVRSHALLEYLLRVICSLDQWRTI
jgi:hypothetical protein